MAAIPQTGFLVLADLTGYTAYLSESEIEHAPVIAGDLLETIVDWQPYDHIGWRVAVPGVGPVESAVDRDRQEGGTRVHLRWAVDEPAGPDDGRFAPFALERRAALERLATLLAADDGAMTAQEADA